jgi:O-antigen/teichoic acid export membrane protein
MASSVFSRVAGLATLTGAGQLIVIGTLPLYSRLFDPATYGEYVIFVGAFTVVSVLAGVRYDTAIVLPRSDAVAATLSWLVMGIALLISAVVALGTFVASLLQQAASPSPIIDPNFGYALAAATLIGSLQRCFASWCVRRGRFLLLGWAQFVLSLMTVVAQLSLVRMMMEPLAALVWGFVCALALQALCVSFGQVGAVARSWAPAKALRGMSVAARKYRRFPTYMVGYALASTARDRLVQLALGLGAGSAVVGRFGLAYRVVFAPNSLIYSAVSPVFYGIASREGRAATGRFAAGAVEILFVALVVPYMAFAIEAPALTDAVLSDKWRGTGPYLTALAGPALLLAATCWLDRAFDSFRRQHVAFALEASFTVAAVTLVGCAARFVDSVAVTWGFAALAVVYYWVYFLMTFLACGFDLRQFRHTCMTGLIVLTAALALGILVHQTPQLVWRAPAYGAVMVAVIAFWIRFRGGARTLQMLLQSRVPSVPSQTTLERG